jgi:hypothetical protein
MMVNFNDFTNIKIINNYLFIQTIEHMKKKHDILHWKSRSWPATGKKKCGSVKPDNGIPTFPFLIIGSPTTTQI